MSCEVCGRPLSGKNYVNISGALMLVCDFCAKYGKPAQIQAKKKTIARREALDLSAYGLAKNFYARIREAREKLGLSQKELSEMVGEKLSVIKRIESGKLTPPEYLARKLERALKIKLIE